MLWLSFFCRSLAHILASSSVRNGGVLMRCPGNTVGADWAVFTCWSGIGVNTYSAVVGIYKQKLIFIM